MEKVLVVLFYTGFVILSLLLAALEVSLPVLIVLKVIGQLDWSWWWVFFPIWGPLLVVLTGLGLYSFHHYYGIKE